MTMFGTFIRGPRIVSPSESRERDRKRQIKRLVNELKADIKKVRRHIRRLSAGSSPRHS